MRHYVLIVVVLLGAEVAHGQVANMPQAVQERLAAVGPAWGSDILGNVAKTLEVYTPILRDAPKTGVRVTRDLSYGPDPRHRLDVYQPEGRRNVPIVVFIHGGAYVRGERNINSEVYGNVATYFARQGMLGVNATYRLAPAATWPAGGEDVSSIVRWLRAHGAQYGGDSQRIYLIGHSAGATHVASYAFIRSLQPAQGAGIAGIVLMSGRYQVEADPRDPNRANMEAYFGADAAAYTARSVLSHVTTAAAIPTFIVIAEYENPGLDTQGALLFTALCERDRACPRFTRLERHNHLSETFQFNTADDVLGREILEFIRRGR